MLFSLSIFIFLLGLLIGSFLNCVIYRLEMREKGEVTCFINGRPQRKALGFLWGKSFCPNCKYVLAWYDLVPLLSYLSLKGKCRYCGKKISIQYPLVEITTALLFLLIFWIFNFGTLLYLIYLLVISSFLIIIFVFDLKHYIIPDFATYSAIFIVLAFKILEFIQNLDVSNYIFAGLGATLFFFLIYAISRGKWMGFGDVKLALFMGLFLGYPAILIALFFSFFIGAIIGIILMMLKKKGLRSEVPFGPFLVLGTYIGLFWGQKIFNWYLSLFNL